MLCYIRRGFPTLPAPDLKKLAGHDPTQGTAHSRHTALERLGTRAPIRPNAWPPLATLLQPRSAFKPVLCFVERFKAVHGGGTHQGTLTSASLKLSPCESCCCAETSSIEHQALPTAEQDEQNEDANSPQRGQCAHQDKCCIVVLIAILQIHAEYSRNNGHKGQRECSC